MRPFDKLIDELSAEYAFIHGLSKIPNHRPTRFVIDFTEGFAALHLIDGRVLRALLIWGDYERLIKSTNYEPDEFRFEAKRLMIHGPNYEIRARGRSRPGELLIAEHRKAGWPDGVSKLTGLPRPNRRPEFGR